ncbi:MAG: ABC transporter ATP-binding protein [Thermoflavifilum sp.]|nr:ABC transporter ATP-binding protein [Thermoflavifilum sp.]
MFVREPGVYAILGPNGTGKTTLLKIWMGLVRPDRGEVSIQGKSVLNDNAYRNQISYLPQIARFPDNLRVKELIRMTEYLRGNATRKNEMIELLGLTTYLSLSFRNLSGGTQQKVNLATCFMYDSPIVLLDEPTAGLDPVTLLRFKQFLQQEKERGKYIIITTHAMGLVEHLADQIFFLLEGRIHFQGTVQQLINQKNVNELEEAIALLLIHNQQTTEV